MKFPRENTHPLNKLSLKIFLFSFDLSVDKMTSFLEKSFDFITFLLLNPVEITKLEHRSYKNYFKCFIFTLNVFFCLFSSVFAFLTFTTTEVFVFNMGFTLQLVQTGFPTLISFYLGIDLLRERKLKLSIKNFKSVDKAWKNTGKFKICICLLVLLIVRSIKLYIAPTFIHVAYALCSMIPELIASLSDFVFVFYIDNLTNEITKCNKNLRLEQLNLRTVNEIKNSLDKFHQAAYNICKVYSSRLIFTLSFNFIQLVLSLYWIFIRISFGHLHGVQGFATFLYAIQPTLCFYVIFKATQNCFVAVSFALFKSFLLKF